LNCEVFDAEVFDAEVFDAEVFDAEVHECRGEVRAAVDSDASLAGIDGLDVVLPFDILDAFNN